MEVLQLFRDVREKEAAQLASLEAELALLEAGQQADPHVHFRYWHDLIDCWKRPVVRTRYRRATVENPRGRRSSWTRLCSVEDILRGAYAELGEDFKTFALRVCHAQHGRPRRIAELERRIHDIRERLAEDRAAAGARA